MTPDERRMASFMYFNKELPSTKIKNKKSADELIKEGFLETIKSIRTEIRTGCETDGMCHEVTDWLEVEYGLGRAAISYLDEEGRVLCPAHYVNILHDRTILDPTADQFNEGYDIRFISPDDVQYGRYRPEFYSEFFPGCPEAGNRLDHWLPDWNGVFDMDAVHSNFRPV